MSGMRHANISAWQRQHEDGSYVAEIDGWTLKVTWQPEKPGERRGFLWSAEKEGASKLAATEVSEEIEIAMVHAEQAIEPEKK